MPKCSLTWSKTGIITSDDVSWCVFISDGCYGPDEAPGVIAISIIMLSTDQCQHLATIRIQATVLSSKCVDIVVFTYEMPSIKAMEGERRCTCDRNYKIIGPQQTRPADFNEALKSQSFNTELPIFLLNERKEETYVHIIHERHVYVGHLGEFLHFFVEDQWCSEA